jgi:predicted nucleic acid-binding Zn ribbon protein/predicted RNA-binding Zn-ribbon protein involved in translation (DUF1610 family)
MKHAPAYSRISQEEVLEAIRKMRKRDQLGTLVMFIVLAPIVWLFVTYLDPSKTSTLVAGGAVLVAVAVGNMLLVPLACPRCGIKLSGRGRWTEGTVNASKCPECGVPFEPKQTV